MAKKVNVAEESKSRSYYKYYLEDMAEVPAEKKEFLKSPVRPMAEGLALSDRNKLFEPGYLPGEMGIYPMKAGGYLLANQTLFQGSTGAMLQWWFAWHGIDPLRYAIWDPYDHHGLVISDKDRAHILDPQTSIPDKCREVVHGVLESLVPGEEPDQINIHFRKPSAMGFDESKIFTDQCSFLVCANVELVTPEGVPNMPMVMTHMARDIEGGCELRSRFWFGYQVIDGEGKYLLPSNAEIPLTVVEQLLGHNFLEFSNLARILPRVYEEEKNNWA